MTSQLLSDSIDPETEPSIALGQKVEMGLVQALVLSCYATATNGGISPTYLALKVTVIEKKGILADVAWVQWTPLAREGGPRKSRDLVSGETGGRFSVDMRGTDLTAIQEVQPGQRMTDTIVLALPGLLAAPDDAVLKAFWRRHRGATFKVVLEALEVESRTNPRKVRTLATRTFDPAFSVDLTVTGPVVEEETLRLDLRLE